MDRTEISAKLKEVLGSSNVYFQSPPSTGMSYPAILYSIKDMPSKPADNRPFVVGTVYSITVLDKDPDSLIPGKMMGLKGCRFDRRFIQSNLYHNIFTLNF